MRRALGLCVAFALALGFGQGCLDAGDPVLATRDTDPPTLLATTGDGGVIALDQVDPQQIFVTAIGTLSAYPPGSPPTVDLVDPQYFYVTFSEPMDVRSLRPGIGLLDPTLSPLVLDLTTPVSLSSEAVQQTSAPWTIRLHPHDPLVSSSRYYLTFSNVLTDAAGNPLLLSGEGGQELRIPFKTGL